MKTQGVFRIAGSVRLSVLHARLLAVNRKKKGEATGRKGMILDLKYTS